MSGQSCQITEALCGFGTRWGRAIVLTLALGACASAQAQVGGGVLSNLPPSGSRPTFQNPYRLQTRDAVRVKPVWTRAGLEAAPPALPRNEGYGIPVYDPESNAWFVTAQGSLVRLDPNGSKIVVLGDMQARDVDVRAKRGLAVSREPNDTIVLHQWAGREHQRKVLLSGPQFFNPRFSPDGSKVLVAESRARGGHIWLVTRDGAPVDLGQGNGASWHPDGERVVFTRVAHDGYTITSSDVFLLSPATRKELKLAHTEAPAALEPVISSDGRWIAFADKDRKNAFVVEIPASVANEAR
jgi:hypothetical protein